MYCGLLVKGGIHFGTAWFDEDVLLDVVVVKANRDIVLLHLCFEGQLNGHIWYHSIVYIVVLFTNQ